MSDDSLKQKGEQLARDIEAFSNALEAAGIKGPHYDTEKDTVSLPLLAVLYAHHSLTDNPDQVPTQEELRQKLVGTLGSS